MTENRWVSLVKWSEKGPGPHFAGFLVPCLERPFPGLSDPLKLARCGIGHEDSDDEEADDLLFI